MYKMKSAENIPEESINNTDENSIKNSNLSWGIISRLKWFVSGVFLAIYACCVSISVSPALSEDLERKILEYVKTPYKAEFVDLGKLELFNETTSSFFSSWFKSDQEEESIKLWTLTFNENSKNIPLVVIHGFCAAGGLWALNIDALAASRTVYAFDVLGFGRSSRPAFSDDPTQVELQHVEAIEAWRREMNLERFVLLGHSMGGFLSAAYALRYPQRVVHLILADPWGIPEKPADVEKAVPILNTTRGKIFTAVLSRISPLGFVRAFGTFGLGPSLINKFRSDLVQKFIPLNQDGKIDVAEYIYLSNAQNPTGEVAMRTMTDTFAWAKNPMINRIDKLKAEVDLSVIYGGSSWVPRVPQTHWRQLRPKGSFLKIHILEGAGHHVYADDKFSFHKIVNDAGSSADHFISS